MVKLIGILTGFVAGVVLMAMVTTLLSAPIAALTMLVIGVAHSYNEVIPAFGFMETWALVIAGRIALLNASAQSKV